MKLTGIKNNNYFSCQDEKIYVFYQVALYKQKNMGYYVRKLIIQKDDIIEIKEMYCNDDQYAKAINFLKNKNNNTYKFYPTWDKNTIKYPEPVDIHLLTSDLLNRK